MRKVLNLLRAGFLLRSRRQPPALRQNIGVQQGLGTHTHQCSRTWDAIGRRWMACINCKAAYVAHSWDRHLTIVMCADDLSFIPCIWGSKHFASGNQKQVLLLPDVYPSATPRNSLS